MKAFILLKAPAKRSGEVAKALREIEGVVQAWALYGEVDVMAEVEVENLHALDDLVMKRIQELSQVESTRTYIVIEAEDLYQI